MSSFHERLLVYYNIRLKYKSTFISGAQHSHPTSKRFL